MCLKDTQLTKTHEKAFRDFCRILEAFFHYEFHSHLEKLKSCYAPFNPNADTRYISRYTASEKKDLRQQLVSEMTHVLNAANFERITEEDLKQALAEESLFQIRLEVDFNDFEDVIFYRRAESIKAEEIKEAVLAYYPVLESWTHDIHRKSSGQQTISNENRAVFFR